MVKSKISLNFIRTDTLPDNIREQIIEDDLLVFPRSYHIHPDKLDPCFFCSKETKKDGIKILEKCPGFEYEDDYDEINDPDMSLVCAHCYADGFHSYCELYVDPDLMQKAGIKI